MEFLREVQHRTFEAFRQDQSEKNLHLRNPLDLDSLTKISTLPPKQLALGERLKLYSTQQEYIDSLNLREVAHQTFALLSESMKSISRHLDPERRVQDDVNNYQMLFDLT